MDKSDHYIEVAIALPVYPTYTYQVPEHLVPLVSEGKRVLAPFKNRKVTGYVLGPCNGQSLDGIKAIEKVLDEVSLFPASMIPFFKWIANYYMYPVGEVIKTVLPKGINLYDFSRITITEAGKRARDNNLVSSQENELLSQLNPGCLLKNLNGKSDTPLSKGLITTMERNGLITRTREFEGAKTMQKRERFISLIRADLPKDRHFAPRKTIIDLLAESPEISLKKLTGLIPGSPGTLKYLEKAGYISVTHKPVYRDPFGEPIEPDIPHLVTGDQQQVISAVINSLGKGFAAYLLSGVTGSGKTEVYMRVAKAALDMGQNVIVLVPEIALITQTERQFRARFGECVALLHSGLSSGERYDQWIRIALKESSIVIGARSAVFAPFEKAGLIIVDEEHDDSYKQDSGLRYNARDIAVMRSKIQKGVVLLGSATPSVQSIYNARSKKFIPLSLKNRITNHPLPEITLADLKANRDNRGVRRFITPVLLEAMKKTLERKEQALLFLNRRGFANFPVCAACGETMKCNHCDITLTLHTSANAYKCHFCGFSRPASSNCPVCDSSSIKLLGLGTEKIEAAAQALFPNARVARMDRDTTTRKGSIVHLLKKLRNREIDILVGTQMIAKGHDFPNITLVGIICADLSLSFPDFRAGERTFQLLAQVAGRAGRGTSPGQVILQTYNPDHFSIQTAKNQDVEEFYQKEIRYRKALNYPPFSRMVQLKISGKDKPATKAHALGLGEACRRLQEDQLNFIKQIEVLGPIEAPLSKLANRYRWQILLKGLTVASLHQFVHLLLLQKNTGAVKKHAVRVTVDVDPFFMM